MLFNIRIENFGRITKADIRIGDFTVFAGKNSTGKSYVSKAIYSLFGAMHANHLAVVLNPYLLPLSRGLSSLEEYFAEEEIGEMEALVDMRHAVDGLRNIMRQVSRRNDVDEFDAITEALPEIREFLDKIESAFPRLEKAIAPVAGDPDIIFLEMIGNIEETVRGLDNIKGFGPDRFVIDGVKYEIEENFLQNFQISQTSHLRGEMNGHARLEVDKIGAKVEIGEAIDWTVQKSGLRFMREYSRVLYLESPIFWRLKDALDNVEARYRHWRNPITGVPKYYHDMGIQLRQSYPGEPICPDVLKKLTGDSVLGGRVAVGESGDLFFQSNKGKRYPLRMAATGIANLGMLALLIEKNLLDQNTLLFVDEPEAHLHPAWQVEMAEALYALSQKGVKVVIATHSTNIIKWVDVKARKESRQEKGAENRFALNHFVNGQVEQRDDFFQQIGEIKEDLMEPYQHLFIEGMRE